MKKLSEAILKADFKKRVKQVRPNWIVFTHQAWTSNGLPDLSVTTETGTTWCEFKYADPGIEHTTSQDVTACQLEALAGNCIHVVYFDNKQYQFTFVVRPKDIFQRTFNPSCFAAKGQQGFLLKAVDIDHDAVIGFLDGMFKGIEQVVITRD